LHRPAGRLHYLDEGRGEPIVMVHGNPTWSFYFRNLVLGLRDSYRCIVPDHIGCGLSDKPTLEQYDFSLTSRIDDLDNLLTSLNLTEKITLIVQDWGGMIGLSYAARYPEKIARIIATNTGCGPLPKSKPFPWSLWLGRNTRLGAWLILHQNLFCKLAAKWCVTKKPLTTEVREMFLKPYDSPEHRLAVLKFVQTIPLSDKDPGYAIVTDTALSLAKFANTPTLLLWGLKDFVFDKHFLADFQTRLPHAVTHTYPDCGHYLLEDAGEECLQLIKEFLQQTKR
jgi:cis-3-alkyl-4-acyloxetan-2-one decarboxylase